MSHGRVPPGTDLIFQDIRIQEDWATRLLSAPEDEDGRLPATETKLDVWPAGSEHQGDLTPCIRDHFERVRGQSSDKVTVTLLRFQVLSEPERLGADPLCGAAVVE